MAIIYQAENVDFPDIKRREVSYWIRTVAAFHGKRIEDVSYIFCNDEEILRLNNEYLGHDYYTDIITFDYSEGNRLSGDLFISLDTVRSNAGKYAVSLEEELHRVIVHGILHLCGCKDKTEEEAQQMRRYEDEALRLRLERKAKK